MKKICNGAIQSKVHMYRTLPTRLTSLIARWASNDATSNTIFTNDKQYTNNSKLQSSAETNALSSSSKLSSTPLYPVYFNTNRNTPMQICITQKNAPSRFNLNNISRSVADIPSFLEHQKHGAVRTIQEPTILHDKCLQGLSFENSPVLLACCECLKCENALLLCMGEADEAIFLFVSSSSSSSSVSQVVSAVNLAVLLGLWWCLSSFSSLALCSVICSENVTFDGIAVESSSTLPFLFLSIFGLLCNVSSNSPFSSSFVSSISLLESIDEEEDDDEEECTSPILSFSNINCSLNRFGKLEEGAADVVDGIGGGRSTSLAAPKLLLLLNILAGLNLDALSHVLDLNLLRKLLLEFGDGVLDWVGGGGGGDRIELLELRRSLMLYEFDTLYLCCGLYAND